MGHDPLTRLTFLPEMALFFELSCHIPVTGSREPLRR